MRVLLISPTNRRDGLFGDSVYTRSLLDNPPEGVVYETYDDALDRGALTEHGIRASITEALRAGNGRGRELATSMATIPINRLRTWGLLFKETIRIYSVRPGEYDLVHLHLFSAVFRELDCPLVVSNGAPLRYLYTNARGYSRWRVRAMEIADLLIARVFGAELNSYYLRRATRVICLTDFLKRWYVARRVPAHKIDVVPLNTPVRHALPAPKRPRTIGFIARDWVAKGGPTVLNAFRRVRAQRADAELIVIGCQPPDDQAAREPGVTWLPFVARDEIFDHYFPRFDVFTCPTEVDGISVVVLEAMSAGLPVASTSYQAMPDMLEHGRAGLLSAVRDDVGLAANLLALLDPATNAEYRRRAYERFLSTFSPQATRPLLGAAYARAVSSGDRVL